MLTDCRAVAVLVCVRRGGSAGGLDGTRLAELRVLPKWSWDDVFTFSTKNPATGQKYSKKGNEKHIVGFNDDFTSQILEHSQQQ